MNQNGMSSAAAAIAGASQLGMAQRVVTLRLFERVKIPLMLAPMLLLILILFVGSMVFALSQSLGYMPIIDKYDLTLAHYAHVIRNPEFLASAAMSFHIAFTSTLLSTILAVVSALALRERFWGKRFIAFLFQVSIPIPHLIAALAILLLTTQSGLLARIVYHVGLITEPDQFPALVFDRFGIGIILVYLLKEIPFIGLIVLAILQGIGREYEESAATLGAHRWQRFRYVLLPLMAPGLLSAVIVVFAYIFGAYEIPSLLGRTYPAALPVLAYRNYTDFDLNARPEAMAMSIVILAFTLLITAVYMKISRTYVRR